jgi:hypothetical protein
VSVVPGAATRALPVTRFLLLLAGVLVATIGIPLNLFTEQTEAGFAWTIQPPLTAAFLGAAYWAAAVLELLAARERLWANGRIAVPAVLVFTLLTLGVTVVHLDRFHLDSDQPLALLVTWAWIAVYALFPVLLGIALVMELRRRHVDPPVMAPVQPWVHVLLLVQAVALLVPGLVLLAAPTLIAPAWPWELTPLTARAIGAWLVGLAIVSFQMRAEGDWQRLRPSTVSSAVFVVLQLVAIARFGSVADWSQPLGLVLLAILASMSVIAVIGIPAAWRTPAAAGSIAEART